VPSFELNSKTLLQGKIYLNEMPKFNKTSNIIRLHAHGELQNTQHLKNLLTIVKANPTKTFSLYTKRIDIINDIFAKAKIPSNLIMVYSNPVIDKPITKVPMHFNKVFNVCRDKYKDRINCGAKSCNTCRLCYDKAKTNIIYEMIK